MQAKLAASATPRQAPPPPGIGCAQPPQLDHPEQGDDYAPVRETLGRTAEVPNGLEEDAHGDLPGQADACSKSGEDAAVRKDLGRTSSCSSGSEDEPADAACECTLQESPVKGLLANGGRMYAAADNVHPVGTEEAQQARFATAQDEKQHAHWDLRSASRELEFPDLAHSHPRREQPLYAGRMQGSGRLSAHAECNDNTNSITSSRYKNLHQDAAASHGPSELCSDMQPSQQHKSSAADSDVMQDPVSNDSAEQLSEGVGSTADGLGHTQDEVYDMDRERLADTHNVTADVSDALSEAGSSNALHHVGHRAAFARSGSRGQDASRNSGGQTAAGAGRPAVGSKSDSEAVAGSGSMSTRRIWPTRLLRGSLQTQTMARLSLTGCSVLLIGWLIASRRHRIILAAIRFLLKIFKLYNETLLRLH